MDVLAADDVADDAAEGVAVIGVEGLAVEMGGEEEVVGEGDIEGEIGGVFVFGVLDDEIGAGFGGDDALANEFSDGDAFPEGIEFGPAGDAMDIHFELGFGELVELLPSPSFFLLYVAKDAEGPGVEIGFGDGAVV